MFHYWPATVLLHFYSWLNLIKHLLMLRQQLNWNPSGRRYAYIYAYETLIVLDVLISSLNSTVLMHLQGYFRKGCILEAMEQYDDVCFKVTIIFIFCDNDSSEQELVVLVFCYWCLSYPHIVGLSCLSNSFAIQSTKFWSFKKDQEDFPVGKR